MGETGPYPVLCQYPGCGSRCLDPEQFQRVLSNVLGNSVKYRARMAGWKSGWNRESRAMCGFFWGSGQGVTQDQLNKIFDSFTGRTGPGPMWPVAADWAWPL